MQNWCYLHQSSVLKIFILKANQCFSTKGCLIMDLI